MNNLHLIKQKNFGAVQCDFCYDEKGNILIMDAQIGKALEYPDPCKAIEEIHKKNYDRINKFSTIVTFPSRDLVFYQIRGVFEICRWSQQPKADAFYEQEAVPSADVLFGC